MAEVGQVLAACDVEPDAGLGLGIPGRDGGVLTGEAAYAARYTSWAAAGGLGAKVGAFVDGSANFLRSMGMPLGVATALMGVLVASFAGTTLDTACRLQRYVVQELAACLGVGWACGVGGASSPPAGRMPAPLVRRAGTTCRST